MLNKNEFFPKSGNMKPGKQKRFPKMNSQFSIKIHEDMDLVGISIYESSTLIKEC